MLTRRFLLTAALAATLASPAFGHSYTQGPLKIGHPWARATVTPTGGAYLSIENTGATADRLLRVSTPMAASAEMHTHIKEGDVMRMRPVEVIDLPAGKTTLLEPGGYHIMLLGLKKPLKEGERFPLVLEFEKAGKIQVEIAVDKAGAGAASPEHKDHKH